MEKLQAALQKARGQRALGGDGPTNDSLARERTSQPGPVSGPTSGLNGAAARQAAGYSGGYGAAADSAARAERIAAAWEALTPCEMDRGQLARRRVVALDQGPASAPFDMLRTRVMQMMSANGWRRLAITSPDMGCGKTTLSANLALSLSRQRELRTLLYDCDMRRPSLGQTLGLPSGRSLGTDAVLGGEARFADVAYRLDGTLAVIANTGFVPGSAELLQSARCAEAIAGIEADYDPALELFDLPPLLACDDTVGFLGQVDCAILVIEADVTPVDAIDRCERELAERTNLLGVVVNKNHFDETVDNRSTYYY